MNFKEDGLESKFRTDTVVSDRDSGRVVNRNFRQIYLQFPYFTKELDECSTLSTHLQCYSGNRGNERHETYFDFTFGSDCLYACRESDKVHGHHSWRQEVENRPGAIPCFCNREQRGGDRSA